MANPHNQGHNFTLPQPNCYLPVPLLEEKEVVTFVNAMGATNNNGDLFPGQILHHPDGVSNVCITHPTSDPTVLHA